MAELLRNLRWFSQLDDESLKTVHGMIEPMVFEIEDIAGEMGLFGERKRSATLKARCRCEMLTLSYDDFERGTRGRDLTNAVST